MRLYKIEGLVIDDGLTTEALAKTLGSFIVNLNVSEVEMTGLFDGGMMTREKKSKIGRAHV